ncbi:hypothetical protein KJ758_02360 [Patescibacteria group bacterium]|nr:hypothetical protein [Patescibacteria group bacterium]
MRDGVVTPDCFILRGFHHPMVLLVRQQIVGTWVKRTQRQLSPQDIEIIEFVLGWVFTFGTAQPDDGLVKTMVWLKSQGLMPQVRDVFGDRPWLRVRLSVERCIARALELPVREVHYEDEFRPLVEVCEYLVMLSTRPEDWIAENGKHTKLPDLP